MNGTGGRLPRGTAALRRQIATVCRGLAEQGVVPGTAGNVSARDGDLVAVTATGVVLRTATPDDVTVVDLDGAVVEGALEPTSELALHLAVYARTPARAVVHTHAPASTAAGLLVDELPAVHYATLQLGGPVRVAPFAPFGTPELAAAVVEALRDRRGALMANHGAVTWGADLAEAAMLAEVLEWTCDVWLRAAAAGSPRELSAADLAAVSTQMTRRGYGRPRPAGERPA